MQAHSLFFLVFLVSAAITVAGLHAGSAAELVAEKDCTCGGVTYKAGNEVRLAVSGGRAGKYPADFFNREGLTLVNHPDCMQQTKNGVSNLLEFPLVQGKKFTGGVPGPDRAIFSRFTTRFCGCTRHPNPNSGAVVACTWR
ncbi:hypothetical protein HGRIS_001729 [Hohenbuehelia grisea]|uniref:Uncharacterized protein n=1 Tax=Hohenbuehelia grisea TaxID=104357 RepID=A0ABR3JIB6_9AGAR